jgi:hypothetical protein
MRRSRGIGFDGNGNDIIAAFSQAKQTEKNADARKDMEMR